MVLNFFQRSLKIHENLALQSSRYSDKTVAASQNFFAVSTVKLCSKQEDFAQSNQCLDSTAKLNFNVLFTLTHSRTPRRIELVWS